MKNQLVSRDLGGTRWGEAENQVIESREVRLIRVRSGALTKKDVKNEA
jgi:hypothetical protein